MFHKYNSASQNKTLNCLVGAIKLTYYNINCLVILPSDFLTPSPYLQLGYNPFLNSMMNTNYDRMDGHPTNSGLLLKGIVTL